MATRGRNIVSRTLVGSALDAVMQRREAPILHVRGYSRPVDLTARPSLRHALVPLDDSSDSTGILRHVAALSKLTGGRQTLLRVIQSPGAFTCGDGRGRHEASELKDKPVTYLDEIAKARRFELPHVQTNVVWSDHAPAREILAQADERNVDFIAMATRPRSRLSRLLRPGIFDRLIRRARTPILVVKQRDQNDHPQLLSA
jgi:nucleotide-binding universal stress UspA family protein